MCFVLMSNRAWSMLVGRAHRPHGSNGCSGGSVKIGDGPLLFAASLAWDPRTVSAEGRPCDFFNGRIARPTTATLDGTNPVTLADWDFSP